MHSCIYGDKEVSTPIGTKHKSILRNIIQRNYKQTNFILNALQLIHEIFRGIIYKNFLKGNLRLKE